MNEIADRMSAAFPEIDAAALTRLSEAASIVTAPKGAEVFRVGDSCENFFFMIEGVVRVQLVAETGREVVLYRVRAGDTCVMTTACLLGDMPYNAEAVVENDIRALAVPRAAFFALIDASASFRRTVFSLFARRLADVVVLLETIAFRGIDARLAAFLNARSQTGVVAATQAEIAADLGTAREVVSRHLKAFVADGLIAVEPGQVRIVDAARLKTLAGGV